jgi:polysaccharide biosynthesis transport protein
MQGTRHSQSPQNRHSRSPRPEDEQEQAIDLRNILQIIFRHKWLIIVPAIVVPIIVTFYALRIPKTYEATATLEYDPNPPRPLGQDIQDVSDPDGSYWKDQEWYATQNEVIASRPVAEIAVRKLELHKNPAYLGLPPNEEVKNVSVLNTALMLQGSISVEQQKDTRLVYLSVSDGDPEQAAVLANAVAESYIEKLNQDRLASTVKAMDWLSKNLDDLKGDLENSELAIHEFKLNHNALSVSLEDRQNIVAQNIQRYNLALTETKLRRIELSARLERLRHAETESPAAIYHQFSKENDTFARLRDQHDRKLAEQKELSTRLGNEHPQMKAVTATIAALNRQLKREISGLVSSAKADLKEVRSQEVKVNAAKKMANSQGMELNYDNIEYRKLAREKTNTEQLYALLLERTTETDLTQLLSVSHVKLIEPALAPGGPIGPKVHLYLMFGIVSGLLLGFGLVILVTMLDTRIRSAEEIETSGLTVLGILPAISSPQANGIFKTFGNGKHGAIANKERTVPSRDLAVHLLPRSAVAECCRSIRTTLMFMYADQPEKTLLVTSSGSQEGKTTTAISLATTMAQNNARVLLIDADLRRPRIHRSFEISSHIGVTSILSGKLSMKEAVQHTVVDGLDVLPSGPILPNPAELLQTEKFADLIKEANEKYDWIIFDSPPLDAVTDAAVLGPQVAGTVVVVRGETTKRDRIQSVVRQLSSVGTNLLGAVFNSVDLNTGKYGYSNYYYYGGPGYESDTTDRIGKSNQTG